MKVHDRLIKTLEHEEPDRVPTLAQIFDPNFTKKVFQSISPNLGKKFSSLQHQMLESARFMGFDAIWHHTSLINMKGREKPSVPEEIKKKYGIEWYDEWGTYEKNGWYNDGVLKTTELIKKWISYIKTWEPAADVKFRRFKKKWDHYLSKELIPIPTGGGVAYPIWAMIGLNRFAYMIRKHLNLVKDLAKALGRITKEFHNCLFEKEIDMVFICDDWAYKNRLIYNPKQWDEIVTPIYKKLADNAHKHNAKFLIHSDGNVEDTLPYLIDSKVDAIEPLEYEAGVRLKTLKEKYGDKITLIGNISATYTLSLGSIEDTIIATKKAIIDAAVGGGYILGAGSDIIDTCKVENVKIMIETVKKYGIYPIRYH